MKNDWALAFIAYPLSRFLFPLVTFGRLRVAPWERRVEGPWSLRRIAPAQLELGPDLAGLSVLGLIGLEAFSMVNALHILQKLPL